MKCRRSYMQFEFQYGHGSFADRILSIGEEVSEELGQDIVEKSLENIVGGLFRGQEGANENALFATGRTAEDGREAVISIAGMWDTTWQTAVTTVMLNIEQAAAQKGMNLSAKAVEAAMRSAKAKGFESSVQAVLNGDATKEQQKTAAAFVRMLENGVTEAQTEARHDTFEAAARGETQETAETNAVLEAALEKVAADEAAGNADLPWQADRLSGEQNQADAAENAAETAQALEDAETAQAENEMAADALRQEADAARQEAAPETQTAEQGGQEKAKTEEQAARAELENIQAEAREAEAAATEAQERFREAPTEANREAAESAGRVWQDAVERAEQAVKTYAQSVERLRQAVQDAAETQRTKENAAETQQSRTPEAGTERAADLPRQADEMAGAEHRRGADMQRWQDASAETIYEEAGGEQEALNDLLSGMHDALGLRTPYEAVTQKSVQSMKNKVARKRAEGRDYSLLDMKDHARSRLVLDSFEQTQAVLDTLAQEGIAYQVEAVGPTEFGYRGLHITWRTKNGLGVEVQLTTPEAWKAKKISDKIYEKWRNVDLKRLTEKEELNYYKDIARSLQMWNQLGLPDFSIYERASSSDTSLESISSAPKSERASLPQRPSENSSMPDSLTRINRPDSVTDSNTLLMETPPISDNSIINQDGENIKNSEEKDQKGQEKNGQVKTLADVNRLSAEEKAHRTAALAKELGVQTTAENKSGAGLVIRQAARDLSEMQKTNLRLVDMAARMQGIRVVLDDEVGGGRANAKYDSATNVIYLDTGAQGLYTKYLSHELVHYIRRNNAQGYKALENLFDLYAEQTEGYDAEARIEERIEEYARQGVKLDRAAAREELVADSVLDMIANERTMMDVYAMNRTLFGQIKDWVEKQLASIRKMLDRAKADSPEARVMMQTRGHYETVQALFDRVLREASTNARLLKQLNRFSNVDGIAGEYMQSIRSAMRDEERAESLHTLARNILTKSGDEATQENVRTLMETAERAERGEIRGVYGNMVKEAGLKGWDSGNTELNKAFVTLLTQTGAFEDSGIRYDIKKDVHGKEYVLVTEDILKGVLEDKWISTVTQNLEKKFKNGVEVGNDQIDIDKTTRNEITRSKYTNKLERKDSVTYADKMRATNNADEIIRASTDYVGEAPKHTRKDDMVEFARGTVLMKIGDNAYKAKVVVGTRKDGTMRLYDIVSMKKTKIEEREKQKTKSTTDAVLQTEGLSRRQGTLRENNVQQVGEKVKSFSENEKINLV